ncbi:unnamed protein product [Neospora caninum Liverpool]|uniref:Uncharacterized protein n=1 Tax=Neospora caninum (strain Liverpool) TaxID=572307 RepID=F0VIT1_NEOCL|nr:uncharacterized protein NCLIV_034285 [Neospora caninum Liverpool]CBZ53642.1 unnamed protein product [Neospora caninum Liverpool]|eukprot:XP_003883674.1 uncharacterized protein NCLIV_034285 [Neospora caninum Liverpool]
MSSQASSNDETKGPPHHNSTKATLPSDRYSLSCQSPGTRFLPVSPPPISHCSIGPFPAVSSNTSLPSYLPHISSNSFPRGVASLHSCASSESPVPRRLSSPHSHLAASHSEQAIVTGGPLGRRKEVSSTEEQRSISKENPVTEKEKKMDQVHREAERQVVEAKDGETQGRQRAHEGLVQSQDETDYEVVALDLECYTSMAVKCLLSMCSVVRQAFPEVERIAVSHRKGRVPVGEPACSLMVELVKHHLPLWKEEILMKRKGHQQQDRENDISSERRRNYTDARTLATPLFDQTSGTSETATERWRVPGTFLLPLPCVCSSLPTEEYERDSEGIS